MHIEDPKLIKLPSIFGMKTVNAWLFLHPEATLIDCGEDSVECYTAVTQQLKSYGVQLKNLKHLYITHAHVDHIGLANRIQEESSCQIYVNPNTAPWVEHLDLMLAQRVSMIQKHLSQHFGPSDTLVQTFLGFFNQTKNYWGKLSGEKIRIIDWGESFEMGGATWKNIHTPGHSITQGVYHDVVNQRIISSDMLMSITPTAVIDPDPLCPARATRGLSSLLNSYELLQNLDFKVAYPGHYEILESPKKLIARQVKRIHQRIAECFEIIASGKNRFVDILQIMYASKVSFPAIVMLMGYLQVLEDEQKISKILIGDHWLYSTKIAKQNVLLE